MVSRAVGVVCVLGVVVFACAVSSWGQNATGFALEELEVTATRIPPAEGRAHIDREELDARPGVQRDVNEAVRTVPGVQFGEGSISSEQGGEIEPARMSISGGRTYDNAFLLDGMSTSSLIDPDSTATPTNTSQLPGHPQLFFISPELLDGVDVYTSNVPARLGDFTGGVVGSRLRFPGPEAWGKATYWTTRSAWSELHSGKDEFESSSSSSMQPRFSRHNADFIMNQPVSEAASVLGAVSLRHASIPLDMEENSGTERRTHWSALLSYGRTLEDGGRFQASMLHAPYVSTHYVTNQRNSEVDLENAPWRFMAERDWNLDAVQVRWRTGYQHVTYNRSAEEQLRSWLNTSSKDWGDDDKYSIEGSYGDLESAQHTVSSNVDVVGHGFDAWGRHVLGAGLAWETTWGRWERPESAYVYYAPLRSSAVVDPRGEYTDSVPHEQYFSKRSVYDEDEASVTMNSFAAYVEDSWTLGGLTLRPGLRLSHDDFMGNSNAAPRFAASYDVFGDTRTVLVGGVNRYYGQTLLTYALREARRELRRETRTLDSAGNVYAALGETDGYWRAADASSSKYRYSSLRTPYSDETVLGLDQDVRVGGDDWGQFGLRWINRWYEDEFAREKVTDPDGEDRYILNNNGFTRYQGLTARWTKAWERHALEVNVTLQDTMTSHDGYDATLDDEELEEQVYYDGDLMDKTDLPRQNYNRPWLANLVYTARLPLHLAFTNVTWARAGYTALVDSGKNIVVDGESYDLYEKTDREPVFTFDWKLAWTAPVRAGHDLTVGLEVLNVFDARIPVADSDDAYEMGRQFWLGLEYAF